jgi:hypothetical protein
MTEHCDYPVGDCLVGKEKRQGIFWESGDSLEREAERIRAVIDARGKGTFCKACAQLCACRPRTIHVTMARFLIGLVRRFEVKDQWYSVNETWAKLIQCGDVGKLRYWDLAIGKELEESDGDKRTSGFWKPTTKGIEFAHKQITVIKRMWDFDSKVYFSDGPQVDIEDCLNTKFSYKELMGGPL